MSSELGDDLRNEDVILIRKKKIPAVTKVLRQEDLRFYVDNPRIYSIIHADGQPPNQEDIQRKLISMDHVKALIQDIRRDGGLTEPIIVRDGALEVLEGNSRLAAYRILAVGDPVKWGLIKCRVIPEDIDETLIFALLGQYHIRGKKDWAPFDQAGFLYRRRKHHEVDIDQLALEIGISKQKVKHLIDTFQYMLDYEEVDTTRWSYYDEYLKNRKIKDARLAHPGFNDLIVEKIRSGEIGRAVDVRDRLPVICAAPRILKKFVKENVDFGDAYEQAVEDGADTTPLKRVKAFRSWLARSDVKRALAQLQGEPRRKIEYEFKKLCQLTAQVNDRLKSGK